MKKKTAPAVELRSRKNRSCRGCDTATRNDSTEDGLCLHTESVLDGHPVRCVGDWAQEKIYRLVQYFGIFSQGMSKQWPLNYIEICSGPGRCVFRESGEEVDGTALAIANHEKFSLLKSATFIDLNPNVVDTLNRRLHEKEYPFPVAAIKGDFSDHTVLGEQLRNLPGRLSLVFIDPTECNVPFETIRVIKETLKNVDFVINVAVGTDANRNLVNAAIDPGFEKARAKYTSFLGNADFFDRPDVMENARRNDRAGLRQLFREAYRDSLKTVGLPHIAEQPVRHFYSLIFASAHARGLDFWKKANMYDPNQQKSMGF